MTPVARPATAEDIAAFYPEGLAHTVRAWAMDMDGEVVGLGGIVYRPGDAYLFSVIRPALRKHPRAMVRAAWAFLAEHGESLPAFADPQEPGSARFLAFLGFRFVAPTAVADAYCWQPKKRAA